MMKTIVFILVTLWLLGIVLRLAESPLHLLLGIALAVLLVKMIMSRHRVQ